jgi:hypothetical protein
MPEAVLGLLEPTFGGAETVPTVDEIRDDGDGPGAS